MATWEQELEYWDKKATEIKRTKLTTVQASATKWAGLLTAILGVFGTATFAGGLTSIDELPSPYAGLAKTGTTLAAVFAIAAIVCLTQAAGGLNLGTKQELSAISAMQLAEEQSSTRENCGQQLPQSWCSWDL